MDVKQKICSYSRFIKRTIDRHPHILKDLVESGDLSTSYMDRDPTTRYKNAQSLLGKENFSEPGAFMKAIRLFRAREMVRIAWRDLANMADPIETMMDLTVLAEFILGITVDFLTHNLQKKFGPPLSSEGVTQDLVVFGMGKLGGEELNFSSDIDLIFAYPQKGRTDHKHPITNQEFFEHLCRDLVKIIGTVTEDGFCFRIDTRLRPFGESGPLCMSFDQMEAYYEIHGREWERYALIKARPVAGDLDSGALLLKRLRPFIYRKYLDYGALESLREMKALIEQESRQKRLLDNIKLGPGGIREVEFLVQAFQLIHGGKQPELMCQSTLKALNTIKGNGLLPKSTCDELKEAYLFLRKLEHTLQEKDDQQVHVLPSSSNELEELAKVLGMDSKDALTTTIDQERKKIETHFKGLFQENSSDVTQSSGRHQDILALWDGALDKENVLNLLESLGFNSPETIYGRILSLKSSRTVKAMTERSRTFLRRIIASLINIAPELKDPDTALLRSLEVLEAIGRRGFYLALFAENPNVLKNLAQFAGESPWITRHICTHPGVIDSLISIETIGDLPNKNGLKKTLEIALKGIEPGDLEGFMEGLRHFKHNQTFQFAYLGLEKGIRAREICLGLTELAELILNEVSKEAWLHVAKRFDSPQGDGTQRKLLQDFLIIGYGKLGSRELTFASDLDLVFLYDLKRKGDSSIFFSRIGQRIIHILTTLTPSGRLYEVDMRLRPNGSSGVLVSSIEAFHNYQKTQAWTWEHQALIRARPVSGCEKLAKKFSDIRKEVLIRPRDEGTLVQELRDMRYKMLQSKGKTPKGLFHVKNDLGGVTDIEFLVQFYCLLNANRFPQLIEETSTMGLLERFEEFGIIPETDAKNLMEIYENYLGIINQRYLEGRTLEIKLSPWIKEMKEFVMLKIFY
ncbi:Glutamate-ammonia-ligase adenylyltransferase [Dissulfuribacter thermophilus]|uniref:Glutamate-ammonia-ligase adenylyltransferase n=1 Tax=Dissulfuribacter thermophilus TaxID=1156395 RepID=A0A1B9F4G3_9BACT|nr:bifunctional [glutamate--ammonia ligase]-adenylyl-L-tyrosine phosphorylase/[glutamate--ammonia-ligase] adenylyltransferase [Dissulfuribacter thermophilus]OCC14714.1 Glutamate-ammonia-ligase adenylyltransferase [Dissulfuribacter thermophilus]